MGYDGLWAITAEKKNIFVCTENQNEIYLSKYPGQCSFRIYMVMGSISKTLGGVHE